MAPQDAHSSGLLETACDQPSELAYLVDLKRYPLDNPDSSGWAEAVRKCRERLSETGCARVPGFIPEETVQAMAMQVETLAHLADRTTDRHNPYFSEDDPTLPKDDPRGQFSTRNNAFLCCDRISEGQLIAQLFRQDQIREFIRQCLSLPALHLYRDPMAAFLVNIQEPGETFPWHFDSNEFTTSVLIQQPEAGGGFEYAPQIRNPRSENFGAVAGVLKGDRQNVISLDMHPGDLQVFKGRYSLHRVARVEGGRARYSAIFGYTENAGMVAKSGRVQKLFGRVHELHLDTAGSNERGDQLKDG